jgi:hypothetical protein
MAFLLGFLLGLLALAALEVTALLLIIRHLRRKQEARGAPPGADELPGERPFPYEKQVSETALLLLRRITSLPFLFLFLFLPRRRRVPTAFYSGGRADAVARDPSIGPSLCSPSSPLGCCCCFGVFCPFSSYNTTDSTSLDGVM